MDLNDIRARMKERGMTQSDLANLLGIDPIKVSKSLSGTRQFKWAEVAILGQVLDTPLLGLPGASTMIPVIGQVSAGHWQEAVQATKSRMPSPDPAIGPQAFALDIVGDSMDLVVQDGGRVIVDPSDKALFPNRLYVVMNEAGETTFKRFHPDPARLEPCSSNALHQPIMLGSGEGFTVVGRVQWIASPV